MYVEILNNIAITAISSIVLATAIVLSTKYALKMLAIDFHII